jgi:hypothetical protein
MVSLVIANQPEEPLERARLPRARSLLGRGITFGLGILLEFFVGEDPNAPAERASDAASLLFRAEFLHTHIELAGGSHLVINALARPHGLEPRDPLAQVVNDFLLIHGMLRRALARPGIYLSQIRGNEKEKAVTLKTRFNDTS